MSQLSPRIPALPMQTHVRPKLSAAQQGLLKVINNCIESQRPMDWDVIVLAYCQYRSKTYLDKWALRYNGKTYEYDILNEYEKCSSTWTYSIRPLVRQWLISSIGSLVLKNQLVVIPVISIEDEN